MSVVRSATRSAGEPSKTIRPPSSSGAGTEVDDPVGVGHHGLVVLDHDHRPARVDEPVEHAQQVLDVGQVQPGGRLVEDVDVALLRHLGGQLDALPLSAGQRGERLAEGEVAEPDVGEPQEHLVGRRRLRVAVAEEGLRLVTDIASTSAMLRPPSVYSRTDAWNRGPRTPRTATRRWPSRRARCR